VQGRSLGALAAGATPDAPPGVGFVPLLRTVDVRGRTLLLLGLINPDAIANHQQQTLGDEGASAVLAGLDGRLLAATSGVAQMPGAALPPLQAFTQQLPRVEHGSYVGSGLAGARAVVAFRLSRTRPVVVLVEIPFDTVTGHWVDQRAAAGGAGAAAAAVVLLMTALAARSQRGREQAQAEVGARTRDEPDRGHVQELIFRTDEHGRLVFLNPYWQRISPVPLARALARPLAELVATSRAPRCAALFVHEGTDGQRQAQVALDGGDGRRLFDVSVTPQREGGRVRRLHRQRGRRDRAPGHPGAAARPAGLHRAAVRDAAAAGVDARHAGPLRDGQPPGKTSPASARKCAGPAGAQVPAAGRSRLP
jgi:PAS domain-containing protein